MEVREGADHLRLVLEPNTAFSLPASRSGREGAIGSTSMLLPEGPTGSTPRLTLPVVAPPLPDVDVGFKVAGQVVVRPLVHDG